MSEIICEYRLEIKEGTKKMVCTCDKPATRVLWIFDKKSHLCKEHYHMLKNVMEYEND